jgi:hypothetical protein
MTTVGIDLADILEQKYPHGFHVPADIDLSMFLEFGDEDWTHELDLKALLAKDRRIALMFDTEQVKTLRPHLDDDQAWEVLQQFESACEDFQEPMLETIRQLADFAYPNDKAILRERLNRLSRAVEALPDRERTNPAAYGETAAKLDTLETELKGA